MDIVKEFSRRSLFWIIFVFGILCILIDWLFLMFLKISSHQLTNLSNTHARIPEMVDLLNQLAGIVDMLRIWFVPISGAVAVLCILFLWMGLTISFSRMMKRSKLAGEAKKPKPDETPAEIQKAKEEHDRRLFLHLLSVLQREGRFLDFLSEDLDTYEDEQIGAAVRSIHENCKKTVHKYLKSDTILKENEGEEITVPPGFDPAAIKLIGSVTGEPPFKGVVRHRGWRAVSFEIPTLSGTRDPGVISPAEIEIVGKS